MKKFTHRPRRYYEVSNERSDKIKFRDNCEIDFDDVYHKCDINKLNSINILVKSIFINLDK